VAIGGHAIPDLEMSGASRANLSGTATTFDAMLSGASRLTANELSIGDLTSTCQERLTPRSP
jgi:hypothetical protein